MARLKLPEGRKKLCPLNVRTTPDVRTKIEDAARASGRSLSAQLEFIIDRHFDREAMLDDLRRVLSENEHNPVTGGEIPSFEDVYGILKHP